MESISCVRLTFYISCVLCLKVCGTTRLLDYFNRFVSAKHSVSETGCTFIVRLVCVYNNSVMSPV